MSGALFYILSLKHTHHIESIVWWGPNRCGYVTNLDHAGKYTRAAVEEHGLDNWESCVAVNCGTVDAIAHRSVPVANAQLLTGRPLVMSPAGLIDPAAKSRRRA